VNFVVVMLRIFVLFSEQQFTVHGVALKEQGWTCASFGLNQGYISL